MKIVQIFCFDKAEANILSHKYTLPNLELINEVPSIKFVDSIEFEI